MKYRKKILTLLLTITLAFSLVACNPGENDSSNDSLGNGSINTTSTGEIIGDNSDENPLISDIEDNSENGSSPDSLNSDVLPDNQDGVSSGDKPNISTPKTSTTSSSQAPVKVDYGDYPEVKITVIGKGLGDQWLRDIAEDYTHETGNKVKIYPSDPNLVASLAEKMAGGFNLDDIYFTFNSEWVKWASMGKMADLTSLFTEVDSVTKKSLNDRLVNPALKEFGVYNGKRYSLPLFYPPTGYVYNKTYLKQLGYSSFPETWDKLLQYCDDINAANIKRAGAQVKPFAWGCTVNDLSYTFNALWYQKDPAGFKAYWSYDSKTLLPQNLFVNNATVGALEAIYDLLAPTTNPNGVGYSVNSVGGVVEKDNLMSQEAFVNGYAAFAATGSWFKNEMSALLKTSNLDYGFAAFPKISGSKNTSTVINVPGEYFFVPADARNIAGAKMFLRFVFQEKNIIHSHRSTEVPVCFNYYTPQGKSYIQSLNGWAKECYDLIKNSDSVIPATGTKIFQSGANSSFKGDENIYKLIAENRVARADLRTRILQKNYQALAEKWDECIDTIG